MKHNTGTYPTALYLSPLNPSGCQTHAQCRPDHDRGANRHPIPLVPQLGNSHFPPSLSSKPPSPHNGTQFLQPFSPPTSLLLHFNPLPIFHPH